MNAFATVGLTPAHERSAPRMLAVEYLALENLEAIFRESGYVLDFSNTTCAEF
jgi:hypothetical protein